MSTIASRPAGGVTAPGSGAGSAAPRTPRTRCAPARRAPARAPRATRVPAGPRPGGRAGPRPGPRGSPPRRRARRPPAPARFLVALMTRQRRRPLIASTTRAASTSTPSTMADRGDGVVNDEVHPAPVSQPEYRAPVMEAPERIDCRGLPRVAEGARFVPADDLGATPNVVVNGARLPSTVLSLSHWPDSGTPAALRADTSALIVERYLACDADGPEVAAVTNNHYDEDGLLGIWLLLERPAEGSPERALAIAAAEAGDFGTWTDPWAPRVAIAAMAMAERPTTPFPEVGRILAGAGGRDPAGLLYRALLPRTGPLLADPGRYRLLWGPRWEAVEADIALLDGGGATVEEVPAADLAVVRAPRPLDPMALHPRTRRMRILTALPDGTLTVGHRYETWVNYASRELPPRVEPDAAGGAAPGAGGAPGALALRGGGGDDPAADARRRPRPPGPLLARRRAARGGAGRRPLPRRGRRMSRLAWVNVFAADAHERQPARRGARRGHLERGPDAGLRRRARHLRDDLRDALDRSRRPPRAHLHPGARAADGRPPDRRHRVGAPRGRADRRDRDARDRRRAAAGARAGAGGDDGPGAAGRRPAGQRRGGRAPPSGWPWRRSLPPRSGAPACPSSWSGPRTWPPSRTCGPTTTRSRAWASATAGSG